MQAKPLAMTMKVATVKDTIKQFVVSINSGSVIHRAQHAAQGWPLGCAMKHLMNGQPSVVLVSDGDNDGLCVFPMCKNVEKFMAMSHDASLGEIKAKCNAKIIDKHVER